MEAYHQLTKVDFKQKKYIILLAFILNSNQLKKCLEKMHHL